MTLISMSIDWYLSQLANWLRINENIIKCYHSFSFIEQSLVSRLIL